MARKRHVLSVGVAMFEKGLTIKRLVINTMTLDLDPIGVSKLLKLLDSFEGFSHVTGDLVMHEDATRGVINHDGSPSSH